MDEEILVYIYNGILLNYKKRQTNAISWKLLWKILWKILKEMGIPDHLTCLLRKQQLELDMEQQTGSK